MESGYIYILFNPSLRRNLYKIGVSTKPPQLRAQELSATTGVPDKYEVVFKDLVQDCKAVEALIHKRLDEFRWNPDREFFDISLEEAIRRVRDIIAEHQRFDVPALFNKWTHGNANFDFDFLPASWFDYTGVIPVAATINPSVGTEVILILIEDDSYHRELSRQKPFNLFLTTGLFFSAFGPLVFTLFAIHHASKVGRLVYSAETFLNLSQENQVSLWQDLARQSHWHLFLLNRDKKQVDFLEFENMFNLQDSLAKIQAECDGMPVTDFEAAKQEFFDRFSIEDLESLPFEGFSSQLKLF